MAINDISQYFTLDNGTQIANDNTFASLAANTRIKNKNSGSTFIKNSNYSNVFDRVSTFTEFIKATDFNIATSGSGNGVASISYTASTRTVTQTLTAFATPAELTAASNNLKSQAVGSISVSGRTVTYKNINGQVLGTFQTQDNDTTYSAGTGLYLSGTTFNVTRSNGTSNLWWNTEVTLGTVAGLAIKARMPALTKSDVINALGYTPKKDDGGSGIGSFIAGNWYVSGSSISNPYSASEIYSDYGSQTMGGGNSGPSTTYWLTGSHPANGTYNCFYQDSFGSWNSGKIIRVTIQKIA